MISTLSSTVIAHIVDMVSQQVQQQKREWHHDLSTTPMSQTFQGFNDLCIEAHDIEIHLNNGKKGAKKKK